MKNGSATTINIKSRLISILNMRTSAVLLLLILGSLTLNWYYLGSGFNGDDIIFLNMREQLPLPFSRWKGMWSVFDITAFNNLWWKDADTTGAFFRPLPSIIIESSLWIFGRNALPLHLLSILLHALVAFTLYLILLRISNVRALSLVAAVTYLCCEDHSMVIGWIATITGIICVFFISLSLLLHLHWLKERKPPALVFSLIFLILALVSKETAVIAPIILAATTFFFPRGEIKSDYRTELLPLFRRLISLLKDPLSWTFHFSLLVVYLAIYFGFHLGGMKNLMYVDPVSEPVKYIIHLILHLPVMLLAAFSIAFPSMIMFMPESLPFLAISGFILTALILIALRKKTNDPLTVWALLLMMISLLPQMGSDASERLLYYPYFFASVIIAILIIDIPFLSKKLLSSPEVTPLFTRLAGWYLFLFVLIPGIILSASMPYSYGPSLKKPELEIMSSRRYIRNSTKNIFILNTSSPFLTFYAGDIFTYNLRRPFNVYVLSSCNAVVSIKRIGDTSIVVRVDRKGWLTNMFARIVRTQPKLQKGKKYNRKLFSATILELTRDGTDVLAVQFDLHRSFDDKSILFLYWDAGSFREIHPSKLPLNKTKRLSDTSDVLKHMM